MTSQNTNINLFRKTYCNTYNNSNELKVYDHHAFKIFINNKLKYLKIELFKYVNFNNNVNLLIWGFQDKKIYKYLKKKIKIVSKKKKFIKKYVYNKKYKVLIPNKITNSKLLVIKTLILKQLINKFFFKKIYFNFLDYSRFNLYYFTQNNNKKLKQFKINFALEEFLKTLYIPKKFFKIKRYKRERMLVKLIFSCLTKNISLVVKTLALALEENNDQSIVLQFIEYLFNTIFLMLLNVKNVIIKIKGKILKRFGAKKVRSSKKILIINKKFSLQTINNRIEYGFAHARTRVGVLGVHIWFKY